MHVRHSGLRGRRDDNGAPLTAAIAGLPLTVLARFAARVREVALHFETEGPDDGFVCRVTVRRRRGSALVASAGGPDVESAARRALNHARRLLRRDASRRLTLRSRAVPV